MAETLARHDEGVIHGRFQVLHNVHLRFLLAGKDLRKRLVTGLNNSYPF